MLTMTAKQVRLCAVAGFVGGQRGCADESWRAEKEERERTTLGALRSVLDIRAKLFTLALWRAEEAFHLAVGFGKVGWKALVDAVVEGDWFD
jgi:hypothetical protein